MPTLKEVEFLEEIANFFDAKCSVSPCCECVCESLCTKIKDKSLGRFLRECKDYMEDHLAQPVEATESIAEQTTCKSEHFDEHYASSAIQPIEFMVANFTHEEMVGFLKGNIIKYIARCGKKDDPAKETAKIKRYSEWLKEYEATSTITI